MKSLSPNDFGHLTVEQCQKISVKEYTKNFKQKFKEAVLGSALEILKKTIELTTSKTNFGGLRHWFKCPLCTKRVGTLFVHPITQEVGCRECLSLDYRKRRFHKMVEGELTN